MAKNKLKYKDVFGNKLYYKDVKDIYILLFVIWGILAAVVIYFFYFK